MGIHMNRHNLFILNFKTNRILHIFLFKCIILTGFLFLFCFGVIMPQYLYGFNAALLDKTKRAGELEGPKIILSGNSNLIFGIDSARIEETIGMPVVNLGMHAGLGNAFLDNIAPYFVKEGDIVIYCHTEYADDDRILNEQLAWITLEDHFSLWKFLRPKDIPGMVRAYPTYLKDCIDLWLTGKGNQKTGEAYTRDYFNIYGDNVFPRKERQMQFVEGQINVPTINDTCIDRMNAIEKKIRKKGGTMLVAAYPVAVCQFTPSEEEYSVFWKQLDAKLDCEIISDISDYRYDEKYFFDSAYHLNDAGVKLRTEQLIQDIRRWKASQVQNGGRK